jgi:hypothetical protein
MATNPSPPQVTVAYQTPHARALSAAQRAGLAALVSAVLLAVLPLLIGFLQHSDFSRAAVQSLLVAVGVAVLTVTFVYVQKWNEATQEAKAPPAA